MRTCLKKTLAWWKSIQIWRVLFKFIIASTTVISSGIAFVLLVRISKSLGMFFYVYSQVIYPIAFNLLIWPAYAIYYCCGCMGSKASKAVADTENGTLAFILDDDCDYMFPPEESSSGFQMEEEEVIVQPTKMSRFKDACRRMFIRCDNICSVDARHKVYITCAFLDAVAMLLGILPLIYLPGPVVVIMGQLGLPLMMAVSRWYLGRKHSTTHYLAAATVISGVIIGTWPEYENSRNTNSQSYMLFFFWAFLLTISHLPCTFKQAYQEKYMKYYNIDSLQFISWVSLYQLPMNFLGLPLVLFPLPYPAMTVTPENFWKYVSEGFKCFFGSFETDVNDMVHHISSFDVFQTNKSFYVYGNHHTHEFSDSFDWWQHGVSAVNTNVTKLDNLRHHEMYFPKYSPNAANLTNVTLDPLSNWEVEAQCSGVLTVFIGFMLLNLVCNITSVILLKLSNADAAWITGLIRIGISDVSFSIRNIAGIAYQPLKDYDVMAAAIVSLGTATYWSIPEEDTGTSYKEMKDIVYAKDGGAIRKANISDEDEVEVVHSKSYTCKPPPQDYARKRENTLNTLNRPSIITFAETTNLGLTDSTEESSGSFYE